MYQNWIMQKESEQIEMSCIFASNSSEDKEKR